MSAPKSNLNKNRLDFPSGKELLFPGFFIFIYIFYIIYMFCIEVELK